MREIRNIETKNEIEVLGLVVSIRVPSTKAKKINIRHVGKKDKVEVLEPVDQGAQHKS